MDDATHDRPDLAPAATGVGRRAILAAPLAAAAPAAAQPSGPAAGLRTQLGQFRLGANLERWYPIARDNHARRLGRDWWREFRAAGFDHARMFLPDGGGGDLAEPFRQATEDANAAGVIVMLGLSDTVQQSNPWNARAWDDYARLATFLGTRTDPGMVVFAPLNEPAFETTEAWLPVRDRLLAGLRRGAPRHLLMWGGREWCSWRSLLECPPPKDPATVAEVHDYVGGTTAEVRQRFGDIAAWRDRHRMPVLVTEYNGSGADRTDRAVWAADLRAGLPALRALGLPATLWSYSHGSWYRLQPEDSPTPFPDLRSTLG